MEEGPPVTEQFNCIVTVREVGWIGHVGLMPGTELAAVYLANALENEPQNAVPAASQ